jgi:hydroxymethylglutaryl-CoA lyase
MLSNVLKPRCIIYKNIIPILTDVTLRDGLQTEPDSDWCLSKKQDLYHKIITTYSPTYIEIGSFANPKVLPIMGDTVPLFHYTNKYKKMCGGSAQHYVLVPSMSKLDEALSNNVNHMSFLTSVSDTFQKKNVNRSLDETKIELKTMTKILEEYPNIRKKLYISCINECPLTGPIDIDVVLHEICKYYHEYSFDELCLSDTCGSLNLIDYMYLVESMYFFGIPKSRIGVHLHMKNMKELENIIRYSLQNDILRFDISAIESGGCSVTMNKCVPNLTYDVFSSIFEKVFRD